LLDTSLDNSRRTAAFASALASASAAVEAEEAEAPAAAAAAEAEEAAEAEAEEQERKAPALTLDDAGRIGSGGSSKPQRSPRDAAAPNAKKVRE